MKTPNAILNNINRRIPVAVRSRHRARVAVTTVLGVVACAAASRAQTSATFTPTSGTSLLYNTASNFSPATVPNSVGATATFSPSTATETVSTGTTQDTVGTINETDSSTFVLTLSAGTGGGFNFSASTGNAAFNVSGTGTVVNVLSAASTLTSTLDVTISDTSVTTSTGALQITGVLSGGGGFIKDGDGTTSFASNAKTYTGSTVINAGVLRVSLAGIASATSGVTVNSGGTLLISPSSSSTTTEQFGASTATTVTLNGVGTTKYLGVTAPAAIGALANTTSATTLSNNIVLASDSQVSSIGNFVFSLTGTVSGTGGLAIAGINSTTLAASQTPAVSLSAAETYTGKTSVSSGTLSIASTGSINTSTTVQVTGVGALTLLNATALADTAAVSFVSGTALNLSAASGTSESIGSLSLDGTAVAPGTYTAAQLTALDGAITFSSASGETLTVVPEPATILGGLLLVGAVGLNQRRRLGGLTGLMRSHQVI